ncbi:Extracellular membrane protein, 8-cysteine region, CFEM [Metarhizium robertsii ARSEF 23]|uniref:Extracellular membrane protein, 8-cysteine region, CFEM n=1 Tax=Metarhizium robertsii (strain ARSEF 23 / ATCC MYA-3075) TaxID=655844 RepID=E9ETG1_METRA|nr:Extracellular membrane protein, 8-cysteine region, CFEM [Metarhizium robertsii ARSEF 23]EFZ00714.1 Extracellular membrane protein, 8-cysteine region, CFEM [Metarhizium robertsii ARSEF 23]
MRLKQASTYLLALALPWQCLGGSNTKVPSAADLAASFTKIPPCALECLAQSVAEAGCGLTDPQCICVDEYVAIEKAGAPCILEACSLTEALCVITALLVVIRLLFKKFFSYRRELGADDWVILATVVIGVPCTIINKVGLTANGLGKDVWTIPVDQLIRFVMFFYIMEVLYLTEMALIKLSLSLFYLYIFPGSAIRRLLMGTAVFNVVFGFTFVTTGIFQCTPISRYWTQYVDHDSPGHCININLFAWVHAALNIALDVWMIAIPLSQIKKLELHWKKKIGVTLMFLLGTFVTIVSILRLQSLVDFANSTNPTWDNWIVAWWSTIEVNVGMICTCLPTVRLILVRAAPRIFSTNMSHNKSDPTHNGTHDRYSRNSKIMGHKQIELASIETRIVEEGEEPGKARAYFGAEGS